MSSAELKGLSAYQWSSMSTSGLERDDYGELARAAVEQDPLVIKYVRWWNIPEYDALARLAIKRSKGASIIGVSSAYVGFRPLVWLAVAQSSSLINTIPKDDPVYQEALQEHREQWFGVVPGAGPSHGYRPRANR